MLHYIEDILLPLTIIIHVVSSSFEWWWLTVDFGKAGVFFASSQYDEKDNSDYTDYTDICLRYGNAGEGYVGFTW